MSEPVINATWCMMSIDAGPWISSLGAGCLHRPQRRYAAQDRIDQRPEQQQDGQSS
jgi:hypothetical protein